MHRNKTSNLLVGRYHDKITMNSQQISTCYWGNFDQMIPIYCLLTYESIKVSNSI